MRRLVFTILPLLILLPALSADEPKEKPKKDKPSTPATQFQAMKADLEKAFNEARKATQDASDQNERAKIRENFKKKIDETATRMLEFAEKNAKDEAAVDALDLVFKLSQDDKTRIDKAIDLLLKNHANSDKVGPLCDMLASSESPATEKLCNGLIEKSTNKKVQAHANYGLARVAQSKIKDLKDAEADKKASEAEALLEKVVTNYKDVAKNVAEQAEGDLFVLRHLRIGKEVPDISGEDSDGKKFKLSDYKGKVVVLDFWANW